MESSDLNCCFNRLTKALEIGRVPHQFFSGMFMVDVGYGIQENLKYLTDEVNGKRWGVEGEDGR